MNKLSELSVFFPLYNEEQNVERLVRSAIDAFNIVAEKFEIILINDGSKDKTQEICKKLENEFSQVRLISQNNTGYGGAVKRGFSESKYKWVFFSDGDLQFDLKEIASFIPYTKDSDFIIGYRKKRVEGFKRSFIAFALKLWNKLFLDFPFKIKDIDCAFKLINREKLESLGKLHTNGAMLSTEFLLKALRQNYKIKQLPVTHLPRMHGKSTGSNIKVIKKAIVETFKLSRELGILQVKILQWTALLLLLVGLPLALDINYMQNDEYIHYQIVQNFLKGNFTLNPYITATFYTQGVISAMFTFLFGISRLPMLTWLISVINFYLVMLIVYKFLKKDISQSILAGILYVTSPLIVYSSFGFMTENYSTFFLLAATYYYLKNINDKRYLNKILCTSLAILGYFVRQVGVFLLLAFSISSLFKKRYLESLSYMLIFVATLFFHFYIFPQTTQMQLSNNNINIVFDTQRSYVLLRIFASYLCIFAFPLLISSLFHANKKVLTLVFLLSLIFAHNIQDEFEPWKIKTFTYDINGKITYSFLNKSFPYLDNVFDRNGFLPNNIEGDRYNFPGFFDLFKSFDVLSNISYFIFLGVLASYIFKKSFRNPFFFFTIIYFGVLLLAGKYYDRYLVPVFPFFIFSLLSSFDDFKNKHIQNLFYLFQISWIVFFSFISYQYMAELHLRNKYIWNKSIEFMESGINPKEIRADNAWVMTYNSEKTGVYNYFYSYESKEGNTKLEILDTKEIKYPFNFFNDSRIYLIGRVN